ncbi:MAG TPA: nicotinate-nucleotide diphosphorylase (carboxylating), partial [Saprospiraceae bacterium]|nr:nicotinate-nucleotide diphosphorylase (carboxylating) [Saprospiraceae bacterium]
MEGIRDTELDAFIIASLKEDIGSGDHTSLACIPADSVKTAKLLVKDDGVIAGIAFARRVFRLLDPESKFSQLLPDGSDVKYGDIAFEIQANTRVLLQAERLVLNTMQRLSGIATISSRFATEV